MATTTTNTRMVDGREVPIAGRWIIDTGDAQRDEHLRSPELLDVERHPEIHSWSTSVRPEGSKWAVDGQRTIRGVTRDVARSVGLCGAQPYPWGSLRAAFLAHAEIDREDFHITWNQMLESRGLLVGRGVRIQIDAGTVYEGPSAP